MRKAFILFFVLLSTCSPRSVTNNEILSREMSFEEFKVELEKYAISNPYPNIDE
ncbi:hypothetical protein IDH21_03530 [Pelagibacterales bacterium SAG-MED47]|nr:hypothetical protein [Pelagibacterales bacterium SAG-MED47]